MSVIRVGSNGTYADGWEQIFGGTSPRKTGRKAGKKAAKKAVKSAKKASRPAAKGTKKKPAARKKTGKRR